MRTAGLDTTPGLAPTPQPLTGEPARRWSSRARSVPAIEEELARIWASPAVAADVVGPGGPGGERTVAARTSVLNLVVVARQPEVGERCAATIAALTGRHPSRTLIVAATDPDGPSWLDAQVEAHCVVHRPDAPEVCSELIYVTVGGEAGRHLPAVVAPLLIHDLPVALWWPGNPPFGTRQADELLAISDRLIVDGSSWPGDGLDRLVAMARLLDRGGVEIFDFALIRQARWREAIASAFDDPRLRAFLGSIIRIRVTFAAGIEPSSPAAESNLVKPLYHAAWLASRLGLTVVTPLAADPRRPGTRQGTLRLGRAGEVIVELQPATSAVAVGTTLRVELLALRRGIPLDVAVTAERETVRVRIALAGEDRFERDYRALRRTDRDLLMDAIEAAGRDSVGAGTIRMAAALAGLP